MGQTVTVVRTLHSIKSTVPLTAFFISSKILLIFLHHCLIFPNGYSALSTHCLSQLDAPDFFIANMRNPLFYLEPPSVSQLATFLGGFHSRTICKFCHIEKHK